MLLSLPTRALAGEERPSLCPPAPTRAAYPSDRPFLGATRFQCHSDEPLMASATGQADSVTPVEQCRCPREAERNSEGLSP